MTVTADSHMAMILPEDVAVRIDNFMAGKTNFPFIQAGELMCVFYLYGRDNKVSDSEVKQVNDLASRTAGQLANDIENYSISPGKMESEFIRSKYINRQMQLAVDKKTGLIASDPAILSDCFAQHVAYYKHNYFFQLYGPFKGNELTSDIRDRLAGRMAMMGFNKNNETELPFAHPLIPLYVWFRDQAGAKP